MGKHNSDDVSQELAGASKKITNLSAVYICEDYYCLSHLKQLQIMTHARQLKICLCKFFQVIKLGDRHMHFLGKH